MPKSTSEIIDIVESTVEGLGYEFVEFERLPRGLMRVTIDRPADGGVTIAVPAHGIYVVKAGGKTVKVAM